MRTKIYEEGLSQRGMLALVDDRIAAAEALSAWQAEAHESSCAGSCDRCALVTTWQDAKRVHEKTERPRPLTRAPKRDAYFAAAERRVLAADALAQAASRTHQGERPPWSACPGGEACLVCAMVLAWRDARFIFQAVMERMERLEREEAPVR